MAFNLESTASFTIRAASRIYLHRIKACWLSEINTLTTDFNLFVKTLAKSLYSPPTKLIGLKSFNSSTPPFFGIRTRKVEFKLLWNVPRRKKSLKRAIISALVKSKQKCQNAMVKPSGLGALSPERLERASNTSSSENDSSKLLVLSSPSTLNRGD